MKAFPEVVPLLMLLCLVLAAAPVAAGTTTASSDSVLTAQAPTFYPGTVVSTDLIGDCPTISAGGVCNAYCECIFCGQGGGFCVHTPGAICDSTRCRVQSCDGNYCIP